MRVVLQRVAEASVKVDNTTVASIQKGLLVLVGIEDADSHDDIDWLVGKITKMRIFGDENGVMNCSVQEVDGDIIVVSQFTLHAATKKGNRPSYIKASKPDFAIPMYEKFIQKMESEMNKKIQTGIFGADMKISLVNDGPVTIVMDSMSRE
ncbi:D-aminoacyl-tRNA deacylase [Flavobacterium sp. NG2]|uniref:D-aminoacyl-tRNA deacylase n=1 Tax=Flavobacterium sp. NG2 TaxID=3097547 RepID=UPI002A7F3204|nr:D-aminoacyl-tRNA deacylase [Flavobacterium sp. NG2]WPR72614.1 D-aminoacyl-tRNA deacylase [Flavobacterium sp. NG2]